MTAKYLCDNFRSFWYISYLMVSKRKHPKSEPEQNSKRPRTKLQDLQTRKSYGFTSITHWASSSHGASPDSRGGDYTGCEYWEIWPTGGSSWRFVTIIDIEINIDIWNMFKHLPMLCTHVLPSSVYPKSPAAMTHCSMSTSSTYVLVSKYHSPQKRTEAS